MEMLLKIDLSCLISNDTRYALVAVDLKEYKTINDIVGYILQLFQLQNDGNVLLFADKWFIHGCQSSTILQGMNDMLRFDIEEDGQCVKRKKKRKRKKEDSISENHDSIIEIEIIKSCPRLDFENALEQNILENNVKNVENNSSLLSNDIRNHKKRKHNLSASGNGDSNVVLDVGEICSKEISINEFDGVTSFHNYDISNDVHNPHNIDFSIPLKKKRTRKHNKAKKHEKKITLKLDEMRESFIQKSKKHMTVDENNTIKNQEIYYIDNKIGIDSGIENVNKFVKHSTPTFKKHWEEASNISSKSIFDVNIRETMEIDAYVPKTTVNCKSQISRLNRGPPTCFKPISEPTENDKLTFTELLMLENNNYPITLEPKYSLVKDRYENILNYQNENSVDKHLNVELNRLSIGKKSTNGIDHKEIDLKERNCVYYKDSQVNLDDTLKSCNSVCNLKAKNVYSNNMKRYSNSIGSVLEMLRSRENGSFSDETSLISDAERCVSTKNNNRSHLTNGPASICASEVSVINNQIASSPTKNKEIAIVHDDMEGSLQDIEGMLITRSTQVKDETTISHFDICNVSPATVSIDVNLKNSLEDNVSKNKIHIEKFPIMSKIPIPADIIGFKTMKLDESYCPIYSEYQIGKVKTAIGPVLSLILADINGDMTMSEDGDAIEIDFREMFDVRLIFP